MTAEVLGSLHVGQLDCIPGSWLGLVIAGIWELNQLIRMLPLCVCH